MSVGHLIVLVSVTVCCNTAGCPSDWVYNISNPDVCYNKTGKVGTYAEGAAVCAALNASLPMVVNSDEEEYLKTFGIEFWMGYVRKCPGVTYSPFVIYYNSSSIGYSYWIAPQPDNWGGNEGCVNFWRGEQWNDMYCLDGGMNILCQMRLEPSSPCAPVNNVSFVLNGVGYFAPTGLASCSSYFFAKLAVISSRDIAAKLASSFSQEHAYSCEQLCLWYIDTTSVSIYLSLNSSEVKVENSFQMNVDKGMCAVVHVIGTSYDNYQISIVTGQCDDHRTLPLCEIPVDPDFPTTTIVPKNSRIEPDHPTTKIAIKNVGIEPDHPTAAAASKTGGTNVDHTTVKVASKNAGVNSFVAIQKISFAVVFLSFSDVFFQ